MKHTKHSMGKKILLIIALTAFIVLLFNSNTIFADINDDYSTTDTVPSENLGESVKNSTFLTGLSKLVFAIGRLLESITGSIFKMLTGVSDYPWADKIVFNAVPLLDINFINPAKGSFVGNDSIKLVIRNLYSTTLALAASFFGIVVLITAIKLVITTIASEKAKYKQAIVDWLVGFVTLFCIHYAISFMFYLNEQLVTVASQMVTAQLQASTDEKLASAKMSELVDQVIRNAERCQI